MTYEWSRAAALIDGAINNTYTLTQDDVGAVITVTASYIDGEGTPETVTSAAMRIPVKVDSHSGPKWTALGAKRRWMFSS